jgi:hypothetical protein
MAVGTAYGEKENVDTPSAAKRPSPNQLLNERGVILRREIVVVEGWEKCPDAVAS